MNHRIEDRVDPETVEKLKALREKLAGKPEEKGHQSRVVGPDPQL